jgi:broad specificity phosphatase PhoE
METGPGVGTRYDPSGNSEGEVMLTPKGRKQAVAFGEAFSANSAWPEKLQIVASAMCRMRDTAMLAFGKVTLDPALRESFSGGGGRMTEFMDAAEGWIRKHRGTTPLLLLTHHPNIDALTGEQPDYGQVVLTQSDESGGLKVLGLLRLINPADF